MPKKSAPVLSAFILCILAGGPVLAGDSSSWEGFYAGVGYGGALLSPEMKTSTVYDPSGSLSFADVQAINAAGDIKAQSAVFDYSARLGYNFALQGGIVAGLQADFGAMGLSLEAGNIASYASNPSNRFSITGAGETSWTAMVRPRLGWDANGVLLYGTGGVAFTNVSFQSDFGDTVGASDQGGNSSYNVTPMGSSIIMGFVVGAGAEFKLNQEISLNGEYLYVDYGNTISTNTSLTVGGTPSPANVFTNGFSLTSSSFQFSLNYHL